MRLKCAATILRPLARVDPWQGLRLNLAMNKQIALLLIILFGAGLNGFAQTNSTPGAPTAAIVAATKKFLATLDDAQRGKVVFDFKDEAQRAGRIFRQQSSNGRACAWAT
jgi:hypothetical protein